MTQIPVVHVVRVYNNFLEFVFVKPGVEKHAEECCPETSNSRMCNGLMKYSVSESTEEQGQESGIGASLIPSTF